MKRKDLIRLLKKNGWELEREGSNHSIFVKGNNSEPIERHNEITEPLARAIIKRRGLK
jgi:predicted RNA binding protein YcfA (HicA-like mRNA interferase family)